MENEQEAVTEPVEETTPVESAPIETETADTLKESADTIVEPKKVSESVPYERFKEVNEELKALREQISQAQPRQETVETGNSVFDEETTNGVLTLAEQAAERAFEKRETAKWVKEHADDLKDPLVDSRTKDLIKSGVNRDEALAQAKKELDARLTPRVTEAKAEGEKEGLGIANKKELLGAIGGTATKQEFDESKLSSKELAEVKGLKYVE